MITATGAVIGLAIAIVLIVKKFNPAYSLILGSLIGGLLGGAGLVETVNFMIKGAQGMMPAILRIITAGILAGVLIGTGTLAGIIANSNIKDIFTSLLSSTGAPAFLLAPLSGILMSAATASTTSGTAVASKVFGPSIVSLGVKPLSAAAMIHSGATVLDHLPHGSFFHATAGAVNMEIKDRLLIIPFESLIGLTLTIVSTILFGIFGL